MEKEPQRAVALELIWGTMSLSLQVLNSDVCY